MTECPHYISATIVQRLGSWIADGLLFVCLVMVPSVLISWWFGPDDFTLCTFVGRVESCSISDAALQYTRTVFYGLTTIYILIYSRYIARGATIGKRSTETMVVNAATGDTISYARAVGRTVLSIVSIAAFGLGMFVALTNKERRTAHDLLMGTRVISP